jgi:hypothetical protein
LGGSLSRRGLLLPFVHDTTNAEEEEVMVGKQGPEARSIRVLEGKHEGRKGAGRVRGGGVNPRGVKSDQEGSIRRVEGNKSPMAIIWGHSGR